MITDFVLTAAVISFIFSFCFISVLFLTLSEMDYQTKNSYSIMALNVIVLVLFLYCCYMLLGV